MSKELCIGCNEYDSQLKTYCWVLIVHKKYNNKKYDDTDLIILEDCPCKLCLVKTMCNDTCIELKNFIEIIRER